MIMFLWEVIFLFDFIMKFFVDYYEPNPELSAGGWSSIDTANNAFVVGANGLLMAKHLGVLGFV